jgi:uncharacterized protein YjbI with pentapeptide repeats
LTGANLSHASVVGANFRNAALRNADLSNAVVCTDRLNGDTGGGKILCARFDNADLRGTDLRHARHCTWRNSVTNCRQITADELRSAAHANLTGAIAP